MDSDRIRRGMGWIILLSESSHIFCCVLPTVVSVVSMLTGLGLISSALPDFILDFHHQLHDWEIPIIIASGLLLVLGWVVYAISRKMDCHDTGCVHGPCEPRKDRSKVIMIVATVLFVANVTIYMTVHRSMDETFSVHEHEHSYQH